MRVGLIDFDGKIPNLALMKLSTYHKAMGDTVVLNNFTPGQVDMVYCSVVFKKNGEKAEQLAKLFPNILFGGTGWDITTTLPEEVEAVKPDYDLYTVQDIYTRVNKGIATGASKLKKSQTLVNAGIGFTTRGCVRACPFCVVPQKEGKLRKVGEIADLINPRSNVIVILDNNFTADPDVLLKLKEIKERGLIIDITQGIDIRLMTPEVARALSKVKHLRSVHYAWDLMASEGAVLRGIEVLEQFIKRWKHLCFTLVGYDTTFEEDMYRFRKLGELGVDPYVMVYNHNNADARLQHFARWVNGRIYTKCDFSDYLPWVKAKQQVSSGLFNAVPV